MIDVLVVSFGCVYLIMNRSTRHDLTQVKEKERGAMAINGIKPAPPQRHDLTQMKR